MSHRLRPNALFLVAALSAALPACIGSIGDRDTPGGGGDPDGPSASAIDPGPGLIRRLTNREYEATVRDLLGVEPAALVATFPEDVRTAGFDNASLTQTISTAHAERYMTAAKTFAGEVIDSPELSSKVIGCDPVADRAACLRSFLEGFGRLAWRRPLQEEEIGRLVTLADVEPDANLAAGLLLEALLQSPHFLFRVEIGVASDERPDLMRLTGYEMASRLSFFLWGTTPDAAMLDAAAAGELDTAEGVARLTEEMLADGRLQDAMQNFTSQWFRLDAVLGANRDAASFPEFGPELAEAMTAELEQMLHDAMWGEGASFLDLYTTKRGYANAALAELYGVQAPAGDELGPIDWGDDPDRGGLLTTAAFLTASTRGNATSPIQRGKYVREVVLCDTLPSPPPNIPDLMQEPGQSAADAEEQHTKDPACAACHIKIDPIGFGLERYDAIGRLRSEYTNGEPVKLEGFIDGMDDATFHGGVELGAVVKGSEWGRGCVIEQVLRWGLGRVEDPADEVTAAVLMHGFEASKESFPKLLVDFARSDAFRFRRLAD